MKCVWFANTTASSKDPSLFVASTHVPPFTQGLDIQALFETVDNKKDSILSVLPTCRHVLCQSRRVVLHGVKFKGPFLVSH